MFSFPIVNCTLSGLLLFHVVCQWRCVTTWGLVFFFFCYFFLVMMKWTVTKFVRLDSNTLMQNFFNWNSSFLKCYSIKGNYSGVWFFFNCWMGSTVPKIFNVMKDFTLLSPYDYFYFLYHQKSLMSNGTCKNKVFYYFNSKIIPVFGLVFVVWGGGK